MITKLKCIEKHRDKNGNILSYTLVDEVGWKHEITSEQLKENIKLHKVNVVNLTLTSDNRLVDKEITNDNDKLIKDAANDILYFVNKYYDSKAKSIQYWNKVDIETLAKTLVNNYNIDIYVLKTSVKDSKYTYQLSCGNYVLTCTNEGIGIYFKRYGSSCNNFTLCAQMCTSRTQVEQLVEFLYECTHNKIKNIGHVIDTVVIAYQQLNKKLRSTDGYYFTSIHNNTEFRVTYFTNGGFYIKAYINVPTSGEYKIHYTNELGDTVVSDVNTWYLTGNFGEELDSNFSKSIRESNNDKNRNKNSFSKIKAFLGIKNK